MRTLWLRERLRQNLQPDDRQQDIKSKQSSSLSSLRPVSCSRSAASLARVFDAAACARRPDWSDVTGLSLGGSCASPPSFLTVKHTFINTQRRRSQTHTGQALNHTWTSPGTEEGQTCNKHSAGCREQLQRGCVCLCGSGLMGAAAWVNVH